MLPEGTLALLSSKGPFIQEYFAEEYEPTIESNYRKTLTVDGKTYMIDIFDSAGMENISSAKPSAIRQRDCFILIYSVEDNESFDAIQRIYDEILRIKEAETVPCILCANKQDLPDDRHAIDNAEGQQLAKKLHAIFLPTSAKTAIHNEANPSAPATSTTAFALIAPMMFCFTMPCV